MYERNMETKVLVSQNYPLNPGVPLRAQSEVSFYIVSQHKVISQPKIVIVVHSSVFLKPIVLNQIVFNNGLLLSKVSLSNLTSAMRSNICYERLKA